mmetsp:Transcript_135839/g.307320  ORF Transcript_135839/g.307320 Transcript_135839/m.307320 type:complete len:234 (-) Transcript_135839:81-782(-)
MARVVGGGGPGYRGNGRGSAGGGAADGGGALHADAAVPVQLHEDEWVADLIHKPLVRGHLPRAQRHHPALRSGRRCLCRHRGHRPLLAAPLGMPSVHQGRDLALGPCRDPGRGHHRPAHQGVREEPAGRGQGGGALVKVDLVLLHGVEVQVHCGHGEDTVQGPTAGGPGRRPRWVQLGSFLLVLGRQLQRPLLLPVLHPLLLPGRMQPPEVGLPCSGITVDHVVPSGLLGRLV